MKTNRKRSVESMQSDGNTRARGSAHFKCFELDHVRKFNNASAPEDMKAYYDTYKILHIKNVFAPREVNDKFGMKTIRSLYNKLSDVVNETFTIETHDDEVKLSSSSLFGSNACPRGAWYASFISQKSGNKDPSSFVHSLPLKYLACFNSPETHTEHTSPVWVFVGKNEEKSRLLEGRPEHTDSVHHDGTWHLQCEGSKLWLLRPIDSASWGPTNLTIPESSSTSHPKTFLRHVSPIATDSLIDGCIYSDNGVNRLVVEVQAGDVFVINTRMWWHQTRIPYTGRRGYSISYARDFYLTPVGSRGRSHLQTAAMTTSNKTTISFSDSSTNKKNADSSLLQDQGKDEDEHYTNIDGLYAAARFKTGDVVLTESELPDCSLPRCELNPSCAVAWLPDGSGALVALRDLSVGDWLTVAPSSDDEEEGSGEDTDDNSEHSSNGRE